MSSAQVRGWGPGWPTKRDADQVKVSRAGTQAAWVHKGIAPLVAEGLRRTEEEIRYDVRLLGGYCSRAIRGSTTSPSNHSWGLAIDINSDRNPMVAGKLITDMPAPMVLAWKSLGFGWGGDYKSRKDAMHFEFLGTPASAASLVASLGLGRGAAAAVAPTGQGEALRPTLRLGNTGESVQLLQKRVNEHGAHLGVDGDFGKLTLGGVIGFQRAKSLSPDGIVGPRTWSALG